MHSSDKYSVILRVVVYSLVVTAALIAAKTALNGGVFFQAEDGLATGRRLANVLNETEWNPPMISVGRHRRARSSRGLFNHRCRRPRASQTAGGQPLSSRLVTIKPYVVVKYHATFKQYEHEKNISLTLSRFPSFVTLLNYDDDCQLLYYERLFQAARFNPPLVANKAYLIEQLEHIFDILTNLKIRPSTEFFYGFCCNMWIGELQNITMFDFHSYEHDPNAKTVNRVILSTLFEKLERLQNFGIGRSWRLVN